ncbi:MAG: hypothetical protein AAB672_00070 [Patescibacteria group bacterium]
MQTITISEAKRDMQKIINRVKNRGDVFAVRTKKIIDAVIMQFPPNYNDNLNDITNINTNSKSFDFLKYEPNIYSFSDLKKRYV